MNVRQTDEPRHKGQVRWIASASAVVAIMTIIWLALFSGLMRWQPSLRIAQGPSITAERATNGVDHRALSGVEKLAR